MMDAKLDEDTFVRINFGVLYIENVFHLTLYHLVLAFVHHCIRVIVSLDASPLDMIASPIGE